MREMKDSGIPWIGEIPKEWETKNIGQFYTHRVEKVSDKDYAPLSVTKNGIVPQLETAAKTDDGDNRKLVRVGDFCINSRSDRRGSCGISPYDGSVSLINTILTPRSEMSPRYYDWLFHTTMFADEFYKWGHGIVDDLWTTRWQEMKRIAIPTPSLAEQQRIAEFLDRKCAEVDEMIGLQEQIIEELKAYKQSVITEAVTKGLTPAAPMRDSGIEWIGQIPEHWEVSKVKWECAIMDYLREPISAENRKNELGLYDYYGASGVIDKIDDYNVDDKVLLIGEDGANLVMRNLPLVYKAEGKFWVNNHAHILKPLANNCYSYMAYMLEAGDYTHYITGSAQPKLSQENIKNFIIPMPRDYTEQQAIADYLDEKCANIDALIAIKQQKIDSLKEYKKSIIYEYVTGKREVNE